MLGAAQATLPSRYVVRACDFFGSCGSHVPVPNLGIVLSEESLNDHRACYDAVVL